MVDMVIFDPINRLVWAMAIFVIISCGAYFLIRGIKKEKFEERLVMFGFSGVFIGQGIQRILYYISDYLIIGTYNNSSHVFSGDYNNTIDPYFAIVELGYLSFLFSMIFFFFAFESVIKKTKYILTILNGLFIVAFFLLPREFKQNGIYIFVFFDAFFLVMYLFWLSKISSVEFQAVSTLMMIGFILYLLGNIMDSNTMRRLELISTTTPAYYMILGAVVMVSPLIINPKFLSKSIVNWLLFGSFLGAMIVWGLIFMGGVDINSVIYPFLWIAVIIGFALLIFIINRIVKILKPPEVLGKFKPKEDKKDILQMFVKPQKITEEEVTFHKEQKICLVCKGKVSRILFVCPSCDALYCPKCSTALSDMDNYCWVCEAAIDETKPVKLPEKEVELKPLEPIKHKKDVKKEPEVNNF